MANHVLNYVRCPYCGGNLADLNHPCDEDARDAAAAEAVARMMAAATVPAEDATADQLRRKLIECEDALARSDELLAQVEMTLRDTTLTPARACYAALELLGGIQREDDRD